MAYINLQQDEGKYIDSLLLWLINFRWLLLTNSETFALEGIGENRIGVSFILHAIRKRILLFDTGHEEVSNYTAN